MLEAIFCSLQPDAGIRTPDAVIAAYKELQQSGRKKTGPVYIILKIENEEIVVHEKVGLT